MRAIKSILWGAALVTALAAVPASAQDPVRIALVVKSLGNGFFEAANRGAQEAAMELGNTEVIYTGPTEPTAEAQIEVLNALIAQQVDAIAVSANDPDALVPTLQRAMERGITVVSWDSGVALEGRELHLNPSSNELIGNMLAKMAADILPDGTGQIAILSATATATNQNTWIAEMEKVLPNYPGLELVDLVYGDDLSDKSYREAVALMTNHPELDVIVAPTSVGIAAAAQAVADQGKIGQVWVTGLGLPSEMAGHVHSGATKSFAIWNPVDLGYSITMIAHALATDQVEAAEGVAIPMGRMGSFTPGPGMEGAMSDPFVYDETNIDEFADVF